VAAGIKDTRVWRDESAGDDPDKGWRREWCPIDEGVTNWHDFVAACVATEFSGTFVFMPFYDPQEPSAQLEKLNREVAYLRGLVRQIREKPCLVTS
jgi:sugar phosphate isomerase/epimerase